MKTVAIVGSQDRTRGLAPFDDPDIDIWVFNEAANQEWCKRADAVFQMHIAPIYQSPNNRSDPAHWQWLQQPHAGLTVYMQDVDALVPCSARYPIDEVCAALLQDFRQGVEPQLRRYFTSTVAYALAMAIFQEYERILIYGIEMGSNTEYFFQRPCVLFWIGLALGRGIEVDFVSGDGIFDVPLYGYEGNLETSAEVFQARGDELRAEVANLLDKKAHIEKTLALGGSSLNGNLGQIITQLVNVHGELGKAEGALAENERYTHRATETPYIDRNEYESQIAICGANNESGTKDLYRASGRLDIMLQNWGVTRKPEALEQVKVFAGAACEQAHKTGRARGAHDENMRYLNDLDRRIDAAGGQRAAEMMEG